MIKTKKDLQSLTIKIEASKLNQAIQRNLLRYSELQRKYCGDSIYSKRVENEMDNIASKLTKMGYTYWNNEAQCYEIPSEV